MRNDPAAKGGQRMDSTYSLAELQKLIYRLITRQVGAAEHQRSPLPAEVDEIIAGEGRLCARARLQIYANAYFSRLLEVMKEDYRATRAVMDESEFENLLADYLAAYPPTEPSITYAGRYFPDFLNGHSVSLLSPFAGELALLERAILEAFVGPDNDPLDSATIRLVSPEQWPMLPIKTGPNVHVLDFEWRVEAVLRAVEAGAAWEEPERRANSILVWRRDSEVHYRELEYGERAGLALAVEGGIFSEICEAIAKEVGNSKEPAALINRLLGRWIGDGVLLNVIPEAAGDIGG
jgi:hypothetical protein